MTFNRRVVKSHIDGASSRLYICFAVPDHPWVEDAEGAAVDIAMTVVGQGRKPGVLRKITNQSTGANGEVVVQLDESIGRINSDLSIGADVAKAARLKSNAGLASPGVQLSGQGFLVPPNKIQSFSAKTRKDILRPFVIGNDLLKKPRGNYVIDTFGLGEEGLRAEYPDAMQWLINRVRADRTDGKSGSKDTDEYAARWWRLAKPREALRPALASLEHYIGVCRTAKHRCFTFIAGAVLPETTVVAIASDDGYVLGTCSGRPHEVWIVAQKATLEDRPRYNVSVCFEPYPFPAATDAQKARIRDLGEQLDAHRKRQQAAHPGLTITDMYNVLEKLRDIEFQEAYANSVASGKPRPMPPGGRFIGGGEGEPWKPGDPLTAPPNPNAWNAKEKRVHEQGLVSVLKQIHDDLDAAVFDAYGWPADLTDEQILERLVALNHERAAEEARGLVRWLRPEFQNRGGAAAEQATIDVPDDGGDDADAKPAKGKRAAKAKSAAPAKAAKAEWPKTLAEQARAVRAALAAGSGATAAAMAKAAFKGAKADRVEEILDTLVTLGQARLDAAGVYRP